MITSRFTAHRSFLNLCSGLLIALLAGPAYCLAETKPLEMKWNELAPLVVGRHVTLTLSGGVTLQGEAITVRDDAFLMDISRASNGYSKGSGSIPRNSITLVDVERTKGNWGRTMGTVIGVLGGLTLGGYTAATTSDSGGAATATFLGIATAGTVSGNYVGRGLDKRVTHIRIVP
jgi:hypothetical protein